MKAWIVAMMMISQAAVEGALTIKFSGIVESDTTGTGVVEVGQEVEFSLTVNGQAFAGLEFGQFYPTANYWVADSSVDNPDTTNFVGGQLIWTAVESPVLKGTLSNADADYEPREVFAIIEDTDLLGTKRTRVQIDLTSEMEDSGLYFGGLKVVTLGATLFTKDLRFTYPGEPVNLADWIGFHKGDYTIDNDPGLYDNITIATVGGVVTLDPVGSFSGTQVGGEPITWMGFTADANGYMDTGDFLGILYVADFPNIYCYRLGAWLNAGTTGQAAAAGAWFFAFGGGN